MPGASPQSHDASGQGTYEMGTSSRWYHEQAPHLSQFLTPSPSPPTQWADNFFLWLFTSALHLLWRFGRSPLFQGLSKSRSTLIKGTPVSHADLVGSIFK